MSWQSILTRVISDSRNSLLATEEAVVIADKYPKARHHYLVLPKEDIKSIFELKKDHLWLLNELHVLAKNIIELKGQSEDNFKIGFHAQPSLERLHLHVISKDFISDSLKTKKHWNSFNTELFVPYEKLCAQLEETGCILPLKNEISQQLQSTPLICNQCTYVAKNMPNLKSHLLSHSADQ